MAKTLLQKIQDLQNIMGEFSWEKDGINRHQSYKYIKIVQTQFQKGS